MGFMLKPPTQPKIRLSIFGLDSRTRADQDLAALLSRLEGIVSAKVDTKRQIAEIRLAQDAPLSKDDVIQAIFAHGLAAEELV